MSKRKQPKPFIDPLAPASESQFFSVGFLCQMTGQDPDLVRRLMESCDVQFAMTLDAIPYVDGVALAKMALVLESVREEARGTAAAFERN